MLNTCLYSGVKSVRNPNAKRNSKCNQKGEVGVLIDYSDVGYQVIMDNKIVIVKHIDIIDKDTKLVCWGGSEETD